MTLLKHEPSAQIPWQKTMLGLPFVELATCEISCALPPTSSDAPATTAHVDKKVERLRLVCVLIASLRLKPSPMPRTVLSVFVTVSVGQKLFDEIEEVFTCAKGAQLLGPPGRKTLQEWCDEIQRAPVNVKRRGVR